VRHAHRFDLGAVRAAAALLVGSHDFTQFSNESAERLWRNPVRTLSRFDVVQLDPSVVRLEVCSCAPHCSRERPLRATERRRSTC
jgi:tRNA U38,U39,U40 pseudouridine synthase TruA